MGPGEGEGEPGQARRVLRRSGNHLQRPDGLDGPDLAHSQRESRFLRIGRAATGRVIIAAYTVRRTGDGETIRIISARRASRERRAYAADGPLD
jgi:uncharacterized DUF497 family protein